MEEPWPLPSLLGTQYPGHVSLQGKEVFMKYLEEELQYVMFTRKGDVGRYVIYQGTQNVVQKSPEHLKMQN